MIRLLLALLAPVILLGIAACASLSEDACRAGDWRGIGLRDGAAGRADGYVANHAEACAEIGVAPDIAAWREGRAEGLTLYCTPQNAFEIAARGSRINAVCPASTAYALARATDQGRRAYEIERESARLRSDIAELDARIDKLLDGDVDREDRRLIRAYRDDIARSERTLRLLASQRPGYGFTF